MIFLKKMFLTLYLLTDQISLSGCICFVRYWETCIVIFCYPGCGVTRLALTFWSSRFSTWPKSQDKNLNTWEWRKLLRWTKKHFSSLLKSFHLPKIVSDLRVHLSSLRFNNFDGKVIGNLVVRLSPKARPSA